MLEDVVEDSTLVAQQPSPMYDSTPVAQQASPAYDFALTDPQVGPTYDPLALTVSTFFVLKFCYKMV